jgi:hypothetical protein
MNRILGLTVAIVLPLGLATTTRAQMTPYNTGGTNVYYGVPAYGSQPYGGFGDNYSQAVANGGVVMDIYGQWHMVPYVVSVPQATVVQPQTGTRVVRSTMRRIVARPRYQLPTGSLGVSGTNGGILYSPVSRYRSYGSGYGVGPYGVIDNSGMWHGMPMGW